MKPFESIVTKSIHETLEALETYSADAQLIAAAAGTNK
jgi:hypothetical protein